MLFHVLSGRIKAWRPGFSGGGLTLFYLRPDSTPGLIALSQRAPAVATATAVTPIETECWPTPLLHDLLLSDARMAANGLSIAARAVNLLAERLEDVAQTSAEQRIARSVLRLAGEVAEWRSEREVAVAVTRQEIADMAGTSLFTASRTLRKWERWGIVRSRRGLLVLQELDAVVRLAAIGD